MQDHHALQSPLLSAAGFRHAFFTREGGVSPAPFDSLNFGAETGDNTDNVKKNLAIAAEYLGVEPEHIMCLAQVHGTQCHIVNHTQCRRMAFALQGDAVISRDCAVACGVRVADCVPVLIGHRKTGTAAAVHAGWRGVEQNIVRSAVHSLDNSRPKKPHIIAAIGPHIEVCCFETGIEVAMQLENASSAVNPTRRGPQGQPHVDLRAIIHAQLIESGIDEAQIDHIPGCTKCDSRRFFSYRRDGIQSGRLLAAIVPKPAST